MLMKLTPGDKVEKVNFTNKMMQLQGKLYYSVSQI